MLLRHAPHEEIDDVTSLSLFGQASRQRQQLLAVFHDGRRLVEPQGLPAVGAGDEVEHQLGTDVAGDLLATLDGSECRRSTGSPRGQRADLDECAVLKCQIVDGVEGAELGQAGGVCDQCERVEHEDRQVKTALAEGLDVSVGAPRPLNGLLIDRLVFQYGHQVQCEVADVPVELDSVCLGQHVNQRLVLGQNEQPSSDET